MLKKSVFTEVSDVEEVKKETMEAFKGIRPQEFQQWETYLEIPYILIYFLFYSFDLFI